MNGVDGQLEDAPMEWQVLPRDKPRRTALHDPTYEKHMVHSEAKQMFQKHQLDRRNTLIGEPVSPVTKARTMPVSNAFDGTVLSRAESVKSHQSQKGGAYANLPMRSSKDGDGGELAIGLDGHGHAVPVDPQLLHADKDARRHEKHPELPHEYKPPLLASEGIHGAGAGVGLGSGADGLAATDAQVTAELSAIYSNIQKVLDIRHKYIRLSLQRPFDNPKDEPGWNIYPPPPDPAWDHSKEAGASTSMSNSTTLEREPSSPTTPKKRQRRPRKMGQDIGEDFDMGDLLPLPDASEMVFHLDDKGVYQV